MATIRFPEGTTFRVDFTVTDQNGQPIDLTGSAITLAVYDTSAAVTGVVPAFLTKTLGNGLTIIDAAAGTFRASFLPAETVDQANTYDYEVNLVEANGDVWLAGAGKLIVKPARRLDS